jgi:hypothetical protein
MTSKKKIVIATTCKHRMSDATMNAHWEVYERELNTLPILSSNPLTSALDARHWKISLKLLWRAKV